MPVIDADTHVDETEETWEYMNESEQHFKPVNVVHQTAVAGAQAPGYNRYWLVDGQLRLRRVRDDKRTGTTRETRELLDVPARLRHMDELGVDIQVLYPTFFLSAVTSRPDVEIALCKSYNRWLADKCAQSGGRLRWIAMLPMLSMDTALEEARFAKEHGASGLMKKGIECGRMAGDPYFYPLYDAASRLDIAICIHLGSGDPTVSDFSQTFTSMWGSVLPVLDVVAKHCTPAYVEVVTTVAGASVGGPAGGVCQRPGATRFGDARRGGGLLLHPGRREPRGPGARHRRPRARGGERSHGGRAPQR